MSRAIGKDFDRLCGFLEAYSLRQSISDDNFRKEIKGLHKRYLALLTFIAELEHQSATQPTLIDEFELDLSRTHGMYLKESISDHGGSIFCWANGACKLAEMSSRSAIENLVRSIASLENTAILTERRVYEVFDLARKTKILSSEDRPITLNQINQLYGDLCQSTHTASEKNMEKISCLSHFPHFEHERASISAAKIAASTTQTVILLCKLMPEIFRKSHHRNREIISEVLPKQTRLWLAGAHLAAL